MEFLKILVKLMNFVKKIGKNIKFWFRKFRFVPSWIGLLVGEKFLNCIFSGLRKIDRICCRILVRKWLESYGICDLKLLEFLEIGKSFRKFGNLEIGENFVIKKS